MDVSKFIALISTSKLWLARPDSFKDKREGSFPTEMKNELEIIYSKLTAKDLNPDAENIKSASDYEQYLKYNTYFTSWHKNANENMIMWELYGASENSVCIKTSASKLKSSFNLNHIMNFSVEVALDSVEYINLENATSEHNSRKPYFVKRPHFSFENEVRLYIRSKLKHKSCDSPLGYNIPVDLGKLIDSVYVHPDAPDWFYSAITNLTGKYGITAEVKKAVCGNK